jgi:hypothetical protein
VNKSLQTYTSSFLWNRGNAAQQIDTHGREMLAEDAKGLTLEWSAMVKGVAKPL